MAFLGQTFDATQVEPDQPREPLPTGDYLASIIESDMEPTRAGTGQFLKLTYQVQDGPMKGRLVWTRLNLDNPNAKAVEIAQRQLSSICRACGIMQVQDSTALHNIPHVIRVDIEQRDPNYAPSNVIKAWKQAERPAGAQQASPPPFAPPQQQPVAGAAQTPAWARG